MPRKTQQIWAMRPFAIFLLLALISGLAGVVRAQESDASPPELQQMQDKVQQLEQELRDLKTHIAAMEQARTATPPAPPIAAAVATEKQVKPGDKTQVGSTFDLYGFAMLDSGYEFGTNNPDWFDVVRPTKLPAFQGEFAPDGKTFFGVRQTRFGLKTVTPTGWGDLKTQFEFELFGTGVDAGQTTFRLRHAYGELGHFLAGQTWSPFMDPDVFPNSLEYWGPPGMVFFRNLQLRWMPIVGDSHLWFALERPGASADQGSYTGRIELEGVKPKFNWPDFSWQARLARSWGYFQVAGMLRKIGWTDTTPDRFDLSGTAIGWGVNVSSNVKFTSKNTGRFQVVYGEGVENYMNDAPVDVGIRNNFSNAINPIKGVPLPVLGVVAFLDHDWNKQFSTAAGYSLTDIQNSEAQTPEAFHQGHYALANLLYHPVPRVTIGGEYQFGRRVNFTDGFNVNDHRVQVSFKYDWKKSFEIAK